MSEEQHPRVWLTVDPGEALGDDGPAPEVARLQCCVFPAGAFTIVLVSDHYPPDAMFLSGNGDTVLRVLPAPA